MISAALLHSADFGVGVVQSEGKFREEEQITNHS